MNENTERAIEMAKVTSEFEHFIKSGELTVDTLEYSLQIILAKAVIGYGTDLEDERRIQISQKVTEICDILRDIDNERKQKDGWMV